MTLVAYWPLQENSGEVQDASGNGNTGTISGATQGVTGLLNTTAYSFNGADDSVVTTYTEDLSGSDFTISIWCNPGAYDDSTIIGGRWGGSVTSQFQINASSANGLKGEFYDGSTIYTVSNSESPTSWTMLTICWDASNTTGKLYLDGIEVDSVNGSALQSSTANIVLGNKNDDGDLAYYTGELADVRIYDHTLSASEIYYLYETTQQSYLLTENKTISTSTSNPSIQNLSYDQSSNDESIVAEVTGTDGTTETVTQSLDGASLYSLSFANSHSDFEIRFVLSTTDVTQTPTISGASIGGTTTISGTVTLSGSGVQGATVSVINDSTDRLADEATTDSNGDWQASVPKNATCHVAVQYEDGQGTQYNDESKPFINT